MTSPRLGLPLRQFGRSVGELRASVPEVPGHELAHHVGRAAVLLGDRARGDELLDQFVLPDRELRSALGGHLASIAGGYPVGLDRGLRVGTHPC
jgi:hypothetical protein